VDRIYHLDRGYDRMEDKLRALGADIERVSMQPTHDHLALSKGRIEETLPLLAAAGIDVTEDPEKSRKLICRPTSPMCAWCWCAPPTCRRTCNTAAPTWA
jgi:hypothetical protein